MFGGCGKRIGCSVSLAGALVVGVAWGGALHVKLPRAGSLGPSPGEWIGAIHVHTQASDGSGTVEDVAAAAARADLDFVVITDHNTHAAKASTWHDDVLVLIGEEASTHHGHVLVLGTPPDWRKRPTRHTDKVLGWAKEAGGKRVVAHPVGKTNPWELSTRQFEAMEIWNADAEWRRHGWWNYVRAGSILPVDPDLALLQLAGRPSDTLRLWDDMLDTRPVGGICAVDAHARVPLMLGMEWPFPSYERMFGLMRQHVLLPEAGRQPAGVQEDALVAALAAGHSYCGLDALGDTSGLLWKVRSGGDVGVGPGGEVTWTGEGRTSVILPPAGEHARIHLFRDGEVLETAEGRTMDLELPGPGVYRLEVSLQVPGLLGGAGRWVPWILTNPVYVWPAD